MMFPNYFQTSVRLQRFSIGKNALPIIQQVENPTSGHPFFGTQAPGTVPQLGRARGARKFKIRARALSESFCI
jgi:hypothetical protein